MLISELKLLASTGKKDGHVSKRVFVCISSPLWFLSKDSEELDARRTEMAKFSNFSGLRSEYLGAGFLGSKKISTRLVKALLNHFSLAPTVRGIAILTPHKY